MTQEIILFQALMELRTLKVTDIGSTVLILYLDSIQHLPVSSFLMKNTTSRSGMILEN